MTATEHPGLPIDRIGLRQYLPLEPDDTDVVTIRRALGRVDQQISNLRRVLDDRDAADRDLVDELVSTATAAGDLESILARVGPADRPLLQHRALMLDRVRSALAHQLAIAERTDAKFVAWREQCKEVEAEWHEAMSDPGQGIVQRDVDQDAARLKRLIRFAERHTQNTR